ncbi:DUF1566 domain-containing protein [bacterium]|nr:DUF1566 domain-containing protein [bacterium]
MKKLVILVLVLVVAAVFWSKKSEKSQKENLEVNSDTEEAKPVSADPDEVACEKAKKRKDIYYWKYYLEKFPQGKCLDRAKAFFAEEDEYSCGIIADDTDLYVWKEYVENFPKGKCFDKADKIFCDEARKENTRASWEFYLSKFPQGKCAKEGQSVRNQFKKVGNLEWSDVIEAASCEELEEDGHPDWRLPNIDELRTLLQNHPGTISGGKCKISEERNKLDEKDDTDDCNGLEGGNFSKFGDKGMLWSSSKYAVVSEEQYQGAWVVNFENGGVESVSDSYDTAYLGEYLRRRCVRQDDHDACETAKKYNKFYYWKHYFENFPNGECATEAKTVWEKEDKKSCEAARKENTRAAWEKYLKKFPKGQCTEEGKDVRNKFKKVGGFEWSDISDQPMSADIAAEHFAGINRKTGKFEMFMYYEEDDNSYCHNLEEDGHKDWRLPTIDELRVLVQNHPGNIVGGKCKYPAYLRYTNICEGMKGDNFSKLGDKEELWSSSWYSTPRGTYNWSIDFRTGDFSVGENYHDNLYVRCVRQDDSEACEAARKVETDEAWAHYLFRFPKGKCAKEAQAGAKEDAVCERARKANTRAAWEEYLNKFPSGKCAAEGKSVRDKYKRIGNYEWSDLIEGGKSDVVVSCEDLEEDGHNDWRDPNIDELRTLLQNHPNTVIGGKCRISELDDRLGEEDEDENCLGVEGDNFSKLGDTGSLDSGSLSSKLSFNGDTLVFSIRFNEGEIGVINDDFYSRKRCVRQDDHDACETAKKYNKFYYWKHYFENFPNGECAKEARIAMEKEDKEACEEAREEKNSDYWKYMEYDFWRNYLRNFPSGKCAKEANIVLKEKDKEACEEAKEKNKYDDWKSYLEKYPQGECAEEAKKNLTIGRLEWSDRSDDEMNWQDAVDYCNNLKELGSTDWRLPNIDELRTLVQNCPKAEVGGECKVSAEKGCLSADCLKPEGSCSCEGNNGYNYNKLPQEDWLWSSSTVSDGINSAWRIDFSNADVGKSYKVSENYVRCVKESRYLKEYSKKIPQSKSVAEAKNKIKEIETKKVEPKKWSSRSKKVMDWNTADQYCKNLKEGGASDWRLPTISELRTLVMNCESTEFGGACGVTDDCLSLNSCKNKSCRGCGRKIRHNKFGDKGFFWSSSISPDNKNAWYIDFTYGSVHNHSNSEKFVRCVK